jgi:HlyD family secretion protein
MSRDLIVPQVWPSGSDEPQAWIERHIKAARRLLAGFFICVLLLAAVIQLNSAVVAIGEVDVYSRMKEITHPTGGVLSALYVRNGDKVRQGQILMRFDTAVSGVNAQVSTRTFAELLAMQARLAAERDGLDKIAFPDELLRDRSPSAQRAMAAEQQLYELRRNARAAQRGQLAARIEETRRQIGSYRVQISGLRKQSALIEPEQEGMEQLYAKRYTTLTRLNQIKRTAITLTSDAAALEGQVAEAQAQIGAFRQQMIQLDQDARSEAGKDLADVTAKVSEQQLRKATASDTFDRSMIRAPQSGIVDDLAFATIGSMVPPGQRILRIVPDRDRLTIAAKVSPSDIDEVHIGQPAQLRFTAFNSRTTPELAGTVRTVSAAREVDEKSGISYYRVEIDIGPDQLARLEHAALVPGMPVEVFVQTGRRSMLSYLTKPLTDQIKRSFRQS